MKRPHGTHVVIAASEAPAHPAARVVGYVVEVPADVPLMQAVRPAMEALSEDQRAVLREATQHRGLFIGVNALEDSYDDDDDEDGDTDD